MHLESLTKHHTIRNKMKHEPAYEDTDMMPVGKYGPSKGDHRALQDVPASYLLWMHGQGPQDLKLSNYIRNSMSALRQECPDWTP